MKTVDVFPYFVGKHDKYVLGAIDWEEKTAYKISKRKRK